MGIGHHRPLILDEPTELEEPISDAHGVLRREPLQLQSPHSREIGLTDAPIGRPVEASMKQPRYLIGPVFAHPLPPLAESMSAMLEPCPSDLDANALG